MTKIPATNFTATGLQFVYSTDDADPFDRDEVNLPAQALDQHTHASTLGLPVMRLGSGVQAAGPMLLADGTAAAPSLAFQNAPTTGLFQSGGVLHITTGGTDRWQVNTSGHLLATTDSALDIGTSSGNRPRNIYAAGSVIPSQWLQLLPGWGLYDGASTITFDVGEAIRLNSGANLVEQRNGTNAQTLRIYNTFTNASNYERLSLSFVAGAFRVRPEYAGTGAARALSIEGAGTTLYLGGGSTTDVQVLAVGANPVTIDGSQVVLRTSATPRWVLSTAGNFIANADNTYDIGASGANRPRNVFVSGAVANRTKAGTPVDADVNTPTDGMLVVDTTASKIWVRVGGTWKGVAVA